MIDRTLPPGKITRRALLAAPALIGLDQALAQTVPPLQPIQRPMPAPAPVPAKRYPPRAYMFLDEVIAPALLYKIEANVSDALLNGVTSIVLVVSSGGGAIDPAIGIHNVFASIAGQVTSYNLSTVGSAANAIFQAAAKRVAHPNSHFVFHPTVNMATINGLNVATASELSDSMIESTRQVVEIMKARTGIGEAQLDEMFRKQTIVGAKQALAYGIVDEIAELKFPLGQVMIPTI